MKFAAIIEYGDDRDGLRANHPAHRTYLRTFLENSHLRAAGPFADDAGELWVLDADSAEAAEEIVKGDPLVGTGVITSWKIRPMAYWSAQEAVGRAKSGRIPSEETESLKRSLKEDVRCRLLGDIRLYSDRFASGTFNHSDGFLSSLADEEGDQLTPCWFRLDRLTAGNFDVLSVDPCSRRGQHDRGEDAYQECAECGSFPSRSLCGAGPYRGPRLHRADEPVCVPPSIQGHHVYNAATV